jgi:hypothetical protein
MHSPATAPRAFIVAVLTFAVACTHTRVTPFDPSVVRVRRTPPEQIRFFETAKPTCSYEEIGHVTSRGGFLVSWGRVVAAARKKAWELGGDAILSLREQTHITGAVITGSQVSTTEATSIDGTVIRFTGLHCRE